MKLEVAKKLLSHWETELYQLYKDHDLTGIALLIDQLIDASAMAEREENKCICSNEPKYKWPDTKENPPPPSFKKM